MNHNQAKGKANPELAPHTIDFSERDRLMAAAYRARSEYLAEVVLRAARALTRLPSVLAERLGRGKLATKAWLAH